MPPPDVEVLIDGARALDLQLGNHQSETLLAYIELLAKWNRVYNLTAIRDPSAMLVHHVLDSLAAVLPLRRRTSGKPARLLDVGSGAGLPGVVLAALMPELDVTCVETVGKKASFIRQAAGELALKNLHSVHLRVERLPADAFDVVTSRAFSSLADFVAVTRHLGGARTAWMAMKAGVPTEEINALPETIEVFHVEQLTVPGLGAERCLVWMRERC